MGGRPEIVTVSFDRGGAKAMERLARAIEQSNQIEIDKERHRRAEREKAAKKATDENGFIDIGPECFTDGKVISYKGENYHLSTYRPSE
jgi:hypothetical protein